MVRLIGDFGRGRRKGALGVELLFTDRASEPVRRRSMTVHDIDLDDLYNFIWFYLKMKENGRELEVVE